MIRINSDDTAFNGGTDPATRALIYCGAYALRADSAGILIYYNQPHVDDILVVTNSTDEVTVTGSASAYTVTIPTNHLILGQTEGDLTGLTNSVTFKTAAGTTITLGATGAGPYGGGSKDSNDFGRVGFNVVPGKKNNYDIVSITVATKTVVVIGDMTSNRDDAIYAGLKVYIAGTVTGNDGVYTVTGTPTYVGGGTNRTTFTVSETIPGTNSGPAGGGQSFQVFRQTWLEQYTGITRAMLTAGGVGSGCW
jgi:hypothetical protein